MTSANSLQNLTSSSNRPPPHQANTRFPSMLAPSRSIHVTVAARALALSASRNKHKLKTGKSQDKNRTDPSRTISDAHCFKHRFAESANSTTDKESSVDGYLPRENDSFDRIAPGKYTPEIAAHGLDGIPHLDDRLSGVWGRNGSKQVKLAASPT
jgi:hypothetical protein